MTNIDKKTLIVTYKDNVPDIRFSNVTAQSKCNKNSKLRHVGVEVLKFDTEKESIKEKEKLEKHKDVQAVEFDTQSEIQADVNTLNDPIFANIWSLHPNPTYIPNDDFHVSKLVNIKLPTTNPDVVIAILDNCIYTKHPDLEGKLVDGYSSFDGALESQGGAMWIPGRPDVDHGTLTTGVAVAKSNNGVGGASIGGMFPNVKVLPIRIGDNSGLMWTSNAIIGIDHAIYRKANVISMSYTNPNLNIAEEAAINRAYAAGIALFAARGNSWDDRTYYPAHFTNVMAIGNVQKNMTLVNTSSYGGNEFVGNGTDVVYLKNDGTTTTTTQGGTSSACPHVASIYAAIKAVNPSLTREQVLTYMDRYAFKSSDVNKYGKGYPQAVTSIRVARAISSEMDEMPSLFNQPLNKVYTVTMNYDIDPNSLKGVYLINESGQEHPITTKVNPLNAKQIIVTPTKNYQSGSSYILVVADVLTTLGTRLSKGAMLIFTTA